VLPDHVLCGKDRSRRETCAISHAPRSAFGRARGRTDVPKIVDWYMQGKIQIDPMITHVMPLAEINNAFELMKRGESIRGVVTF
jgi:Zn-dependent alcohol dehydrogenase